MTRLLGLWLAGVLALTLYPFAPLARVARPLTWAGAAHPSLLAFDIVANVLLFVPLGVLAPGRRTVVAGLLLSVAIETTQALLPPRTPSLLDVVANSLGVALGALLHAPLRRLAAFRSVLPAAVPAALLALPQLGRLGWVCAFAAAIVGGLGGAAPQRRPLALLAGLASGSAASAILGHAGDPAWALAALAGALLAWKPLSTDASPRLDDRLAIRTDS